MRMRPDEEKKYRSCRAGRRGRRPLRRGTAARFYGQKVKFNITKGRNKAMETIPDDPIVRCIERTGYPPWMRKPWA